MHTWTWTYTHTTLYPSLSLCAGRALQQGQYLAHCHGVKMTQAELSYNVNPHQGSSRLGPCTWRDVMIERAMWIASGSPSGLVLMMMEHDAPKGYIALDTMHTATRISIDVPTFLGGSSPGKVETHTKRDTGTHKHTDPQIDASHGKRGNLHCCLWLPAAKGISIDFLTFSGRLGDTSPSKLGKSMLMPVAACSHRHRHILPYSSGRCMAQTSRQINANAFGCMQPQASAWISVLFWAMHRPEK